ncbi:MAG: A circularly permuted ATPgrasp family protein [Betaproteobacteria bacterium]|nr:MAG: A circularly permuted ATPgrasp family protein [Betaproteobacteria bacterium]
MSSLFDAARSSGDTISALVDDLAAKAPPTHRDALRNDGAIAAHWQTFFSKASEALPKRDSATLESSITSRFAELDATLRRRIDDNGVTYNLYSDAVSQPRPWSLDLLPSIISEREWALIEAGAVQRARLLNDVLADVYGEQTLIKDGSLPLALVQGHPGYVRPAHGIRPRGNTFLHIVAFDLACGPDGRWWIVSQRTQAPSGLGYLLENRMIVSRLFPEAFRALKIERVVGAYKALIASLLAHSKSGSDARIVLLTPGPYNETYFEHVYLARYLGITLVEGGDLVVRDEKVWLKTLKGLEPVDVILRRLDDDFLDPLELRADSALGIPGLMQAYRAGNVVLANAPGSSFLESTAVLAFLPKICEKLYGEKLMMPSIASWWCGEKSAMRSMLPQLAKYVVKPTYNDKARRFVPVMGKSLSAKELEQWTGRIAMHPEDFTAQAYLPLSHTPSWQGVAEDAPSRAAIGSRAAMLRVFALSDGQGKWRVLPGGLARIAPEGREIVSMYRGGSSADVWAITGRVREDTAPLSKTLTPINTARATLGVASRAAENLFWFGRYTERLENTTRLARVVLEALSTNDEELPSTQLWLSRLSVTNGLVSKEVPSIRQSAQVFERALIASLSDRTAKLGAYSVAATLSSLQFSAFSVRERLALEQWTLVATSTQQFAAMMNGAEQGEAAGKTSKPSATARDEDDATPVTPPTREITAQRALRALEVLTTQVMAMTGAQTDRMTRDDGWRLLSIGRQLERLSTLAGALAEAFETGTLANDTGFALVLAFFDSTITYRARYLQERDPKALVELLVLDRENPRSLAWIAHTLQSRLAKLEDCPPGQMPKGTLSRSLPNAWNSASVRSVLTRYSVGDPAPIVAVLRKVVSDVADISDALSQHYFSHAHGARIVGA